MISRRGLFRALPAIPFAARAARQQVMELAQIGSAEPVGPAGYPPCEPYVGTSRHGRGLAGRFLAAFFRKEGIPAFKMRQLRANARASRLLDPDLAALRSVSPAALVRIQWARNERRITELYMARFEDEHDRQDYEERHGTEYLG